MTVLKTQVNDYISGARVQSVVAGGTLASAFIKPGEVLVSIGDARVYDAETAQRALAEGKFKLGQQIVLTVVKADRVMYRTVAVVANLGSGGSPAGVPKLGAILEDSPVNILVEAVMHEEWAGTRLVAKNRTARAVRVGALVGGLALVGGALLGISTKRRNNRSCRNHRYA